MVSVSHGDVRVECSFLEIFIGPDAQGGTVDAVIGFDGEVCREGGDRIVPGIEKTISHRSGRIPKAGRTEERPVDIQNRANSVESEGLTKVLLRPVDVESFFCGVEEPCEAHRGIDEKTCGLGSGPFEIHLKKTVDHTDGCGDMGKEIADADPDRLGDDCPIARGERFEKPEVESVIDLEKESIDRFQRIGNGFQGFIRRRCAGICLSLSDLNMLMVRNRPDGSPLRR